jgi:putative ABC transport system permease protein
MSLDSRTATGRAGLARRLLVASEVALAVLLLCGAGLLLRTLVALDRIDAGYRADNVLTVQVNLPGGVPGTPYPTRDAMRRFYESVEREVTSLAGVKSVAWGGVLPLDHGFIGELSLEIVGDPPLPRASRPLADYQMVSPTYFPTMGIPMARGRNFTDRDTDASAAVCIVNEAFVRRYLDGRDPIGMRIVIGRPMLGLGPTAEREIVGVVRQVTGRPAEADEPVHVYAPLAQDAWVNATLVVEPADGEAEALTAAVRYAVARVDSRVPVARIRTMEDVAWSATSRQRFRAVLVTIFGGLALVLAVIGVFGVLAYAVQQRTREFGIRIALGASGRHVVGLVLGSAARMIGAGVLAGLLLAAVLGESMTAFLFGVEPLDPVTFGAVVLVLVVTAAVAVAAPAFRATRADPVVAFRSE